MEVISGSISPEWMMYLFKAFDGEEIAGYLIEFQEIELSSIVVFNDRV